MLRNILHYPDPRLRKIAASVVVFDKKISTLTEDLFETMYHSSGIGLAATQIDVHLRVIVVDVSRDKSSPRCLINPVIQSKTGVVESKEGCLSVPETVDFVDRAENISVTAQAENGSEFTLEAEGLLAICIQHEIDHLDGKLFVDYLSALKQSRLKKRIQKKESVMI